MLRSSGRCFLGVVISQALTARAQWQQNRCQDWCNPWTCEHDECLECGSNHGCSRPPPSPLLPPPPPPPVRSPPPLVIYRVPASPCKPPLKPPPQPPSPPSPLPPTSPAPQPSCPPPSLPLRPHPDSPPSAPARMSLGSANNSLRDSAPQIVCPCERALSPQPKLPCVFDDVCPSGLGCGAEGVEKCRFCGFLPYSSCPPLVSPAPPGEPPGAPPAPPPPTEPPPARPQRLLPPLPLTPSLYTGLDTLPPQGQDLSQSTQQTDAATAAAAAAAAAEAAAAAAAEAAAVAAAAAAAAAKAEAAAEAAAADSVSAHDLEPPKDEWDVTGHHSTSSSLSPSSSSSAASSVGSTSASVADIFLRPPALPLRSPPTSYSPPKQGAVTPTGSSSPHKSTPISVAVEGQTHDLQPYPSPSPSLSDGSAQSEVTNSEEGQVLTLIDDLVHGDPLAFEKMKSSLGLPAWIGPSTVLSWAGISFAALLVLALWCYHVASVSRNYGRINKEEALTALGEGHERMPRCKHGVGGPDRGARNGKTASQQSGEQRSWRNDSFEQLTSHRGLAQQRAPSIHSATSWAAVRGPSSAPSGGIVSDERMHRDGSCSLNTTELTAETPLSSSKSRNRCTSRLSGSKNKSGMADRSRSAHKQAKPPIVRSVPSPAIIID